MRIGFFTDSYLPVVHGVVSSIESFRHNLQRLGHQVFVYAPHSPGYRDKNPHVFRFKSIRVIKKPEMRFAFPIVHEGQLIKIAKMELDIVHAHSPFSIGLVGKFISQYQKVPFVYTHHTHYPEYAKVYFTEKFLVPRLAQSFSAWFANLADAVIAPSHKIRVLLEGYGVKGPIYILPTGIDLEAFARSDKSQRRANLIKKNLGIKPEAKVLICVGRMGMEKNVEFLIRVFKEIVAERSDTIFLLVGDGPYLNRFKNQTKALRLKNVIFTGQIPPEDIPSYYQAADIFVFSSLTDTQGIVILEALASGLPVVALDDDIFRDIVINNKNGFLVRPHSVHFFASRVSELLDNEKLYRRFSIAARKTAQNFSEEKQAHKLITIYKSLLP